MTRQANRQSLAGHGAGFRVLSAQEVEPLMAGSVNKVIIVGQSGAWTPRCAELGSERRGRICASPPPRPGATSSSGERKEQHRVALGRDLQREPGEGRRAVPEEGLEGLHRGPAPDPEVAATRPASKSHSPRSCCSASAANSPSSTSRQGGGEETARAAAAVAMARNRSGGGGGGSFGRSSAMGGGSRAPAMSGGGGGGGRPSSTHLDDDIPF